MLFERLNRYTSELLTDIQVLNYMSYYYRFFFYSGTQCNQCLLGTSNCVMLVFGRCTEQHFCIPFRLFFCMLNPQGWILIWNPVFIIFFIYFFFYELSAPCILLLLMIVLSKYLIMLLIIPISEYYSGNLNVLYYYVTTVDIILMRFTLVILQWYLR